MRWMCLGFTVMWKLHMRSICLRVQGKDHLIHLLLVLVERPRHRLRRIAEIMTVTNHQLMKNRILHGARIDLLYAPFPNFWLWLFIEWIVKNYFVLQHFSLFVIFSFWVHSSRLCFRITEVQCNRLPDWRSWFHLHSCFISPNRLDLFYFGY
jgi:hypothetical protein